MSRNRSALLGCLVLLSGALVAGGSPLAADESGWRVDLKFGRSALAETFSGERFKDFDDQANASGVEVGYSFNDYVGLQVGYHDLGTFRGTGDGCPFDPVTCRESLALFAPAETEADVTGWSAAVVPSWPLGERLSAFAKLGAFGWTTDLSSNVGRPDGSPDFESRSETDLLAGIGLRYRIGENLGALVEYQRLDLDLASAALGLSWSF